MKTHRQLSQRLLSTEDAQLSLHPLHVLFLDFENAFGSPDHDRLLEVLKYQGFSEDALAAIRDLYPGGAEEVQPMMVSVRTTCGDTEEFPVRRGTIQGNTLSPLICILCIDPRMHWLNSGNDGYTTATSGVRISSPAFADDMALLAGRVPALARQLRKVEIYAVRGGLSLNVPKCAVGGIHVRALWERTYRYLRIGGGNIPFLLDYCPQTYLGVKIRLDLKWSNHVGMVCKQSGFDRAHIMHFTFYAITRSWHTHQKIRIDEVA